jgi:hypothetical protein
MATRCDLPSASCLEDGLNLCSSDIVAVCVPKICVPKACVCGRLVSMPGATARACEVLDAVGLLGNDVAKKYCQVIRTTAESAIA